MASRNSFDKESSTPVNYDYDCGTYKDFLEFADLYENQDLHVKEKEG